MRWGIVGSGYETAIIASWLPDTMQVDIFMDWAQWPRTTKNLADVHARVEQAVIYLREQGVTHIIVPPFWEGTLSSTYAEVVPLFQTYVHEVVLPRSRIGKLGVLHGHGTGAGTQIASWVSSLTNTYTRTHMQQLTKAFLPKFPIWTKEVGHWQTHLVYAQHRSWMMRHLIRDDLRYFKDCAVDTILPTDRGFFYREKMIRHRLGARMRFHGSATIRPLIEKISENNTSGTTSLCVLHCTADPVLLREKKQRWSLLDRGGKRETRQVVAGD